MPHIHFREPTAPRYIHINPSDNRVRLMVPMVGGIDIGTDNTCRTVAAMQEFFGKNAGATIEKKSALDELKRYQRALLCDISLIIEDSPLKRQKIERLQQIDRYIESLHHMQSSAELNVLTGAFPNYPEPIKRLLAQRTNLYSMVLRPEMPDGFLRSENPVFNVDRHGSQLFYLTLLREFHTLSIVPQSPQELLSNTVTDAQSAIGIHFEAIQNALSAQAQALFGVQINFRLDPSGSVVTKQSIDTLMGFDETTTVKDYVDTLINYCAGSLWDTLPASPFNISNTPAGKETLSILTQFFLGQVNIYCFANELTQANFGQLLGQSPGLSQQVAHAVKRALHAGRSVEAALFELINSNLGPLCLSRPLRPHEMSDIQQRFSSQYITIKDSPHFDEFMVFDPSKPGQFLSHQGSLCVDFATVVQIGFPSLNSPYLTQTHEASARVARIAPHKNESVAASFEIDPAALTRYFLTAIRDEANLDVIVELLLSNTDDGQKVFQQLSPDASQGLTRSPLWSRLKGLVAIHTNDLATQQAFNAFFLAGDVQFTLTNAMAKSLYVAVVELIGPEQCPLYSNPNDLRRLLEEFHAVGHISSIEQSTTDGFVITCTQADSDRLHDVIAANSNKMYLTPQMAANLYQEAVLQYHGAESLEIIHMSGLNNGGRPPQKLLEALRLLHIPINPYDISFPANGYMGYIVKATPVAIQMIENIQHSQNRMIVTPDMARALYIRIEQLGLGPHLAHLDNAQAPNKIARALQLLNLPFTQLSFNGTNGYLMSVTPETRAQMTNVPGIRPTHGPLQHTMAAALGVQPVFPPPHGLQISPGFAARLSDMGDFMPTQRRLGGAASYAGAAAHQLTIERVVAFSGTQALPAHANTVQLNCPDSLLHAFRHLLEGTAILGETFTNPYNGHIETLPTMASQLTSRHLQLLARNEHINVTGIMNTALYAGKLTNDQIATMRCLVKGTNVAGVVEVVATGGFGGSVRVSFNPPHRSIVIDQSGLQWQGDFHNTGGMFFYPHDPLAGLLPAHYADWQAGTYQTMYGEPRPLLCSANAMPVIWLGMPGRVDLNQVANAIDSEFSQALDAAVNQGHVNLGAGDRIDFKFLKAGMGFFAAGLTGSNPERLHHARLEGIEHALARIASLPELNRRALLGHVGCITLPFSGVGVSPEGVQAISRIEALVRQLGLEWGGANAEDAFAPRPGFIIATTNCGDPHAMIGNEGGQASVDASMSSNAHLEHLNVTYNDQVVLRSSPPCLPSPLVASVNIAAAGATGGGDAATALSRLGLLSRPTSMPETQRLEIRLLRQIQQLQEAIPVSRGEWVPINSEWEFGRSAHSNHLCFASAVFQVEFKPDNSISILAKRRGYAAITNPAERLDVLRRLSRCFPDLDEVSQPTTLS